MQECFTLCEPRHCIPLQDLAACLCMDMSFIGLDGAQTISEQPVICFHCSSIRPVNRAGLGQQANETETSVHFLLLWSILQALLDRSVLLHCPTSPPLHPHNYTNWFWSPHFISVDCRTVTRRLVSSMLGLLYSCVFLIYRFFWVCVIVCTVPLRACMLVQLCV